MTTPLSTPSIPVNKIQRFEEFYRLFQEKPGEFKYLEKINEIYSKGENTLVIYYEDLLSFDSDIADMLRDDPEVLIDDAVEAFKNVLKFQSGSVKKQDYFVRISTKDDKGPLAVPIRGLRAKHIDKLVWFNGITIRSSTVRPKLIKAEFECNLCGATFEIIQLSPQINWPRFCTNKRCKAKAQSDFRLITKKSTFIDWQSIMIQEVPEDLPAGRIPRSVQAILTYDDLVDSVKPGDRVKVMGMFKSVMAQSIKNHNSNLFKSFIEVNYIDPEDKTEDDNELSKEDREQIEKLSKEFMIQKKIARSIAPTIYGRDDLKMACSLSLFAGTRKKKSGGGYKRGDIHVLFVGDPGTGKSVYKTEKIYVGIDTPKRIQWKVKEIGKFVDALIDVHPEEIKLKGDSEILRLTDKTSIYTASLNPEKLRTKKSIIKEVSRHKTKYLIRMETESGRSITCTPDHSFSTLIDGKLTVINDEILYKMYRENKLYLPIARSLNFDHTTDFIDISLFFNPDELVNSKKIKEQLSLYEIGKLSSRDASRNSNIAQFTVLLYKNNPSSIPDDEWIRRKTDKSWIPRYISLNRNFGELIGIYLAEGDILQNSIRITNKNEKIANIIKNNILKIFGKVSYYEYDYSVQIHNSSLAFWFKEKFGTYANKKKVNDEFLFTPQDFRRGLISAYFSGDGIVEKESLYIEALTASKKLAYNIADLLGTFGIFCTIGTKTIKSGEYKGNVYCKMILTGEDVIKFHQHIGFISFEKQERLQNVVTLAKQKSRYQKKDIIPNFGSILKRITEDLELKNIRDTEDRTFLAELRGKTQRQRCGRQYLDKLVNKFESLYQKMKKPISIELSWLKKITHSDVLWDKVIKINTIKEFGYVYDIGTEDEHFIIANSNIITHNSEVLKSAVEKSPRGLYTSGKGSTAVGLTAAVIKDTDTGQMNLEAGAVVLANGGVAAIDEFDKMDSADRSALHEAMEQQTVSIAKAGIVATLKSQTAIIAAANPYSGRFNEYKSFAENARMPPSLLSRFDLIFKVVDKPNPAKDAQMAEFILKNATLGNDEIDDESKKEDEKLAPINEELLKKYIKYARKTCFPILSNQAKEKIKNFYLELRGQYDSDDAIVSILARNLDALVRLSEAHAKMALREKVNKNDVEDIIKLFKRYLKDTGYDKETGKFDVDMILVGQSRSALNKLEKLLDLLKQVSEENEWKALEKSSLIQRLELEGYDRSFIDKSLDELLKEGTLYEPKPDKIKFTRKET